MVVKVKYHTKDIERLKKVHIGDWIDLRAAEEVSMRKGDLYYINLGISMELPKGYEAHMVCRSSTPKNFGIISANSIGIMDNSFCGDNDIWKFAALAIRDTQIHVNDRICQFRIVQNQPKINMVEVEVLGNKDRGGYGSTGIQ